MNAKDSGCLGLVLWLSFASELYAQSNAAISGIVQDTSGAVVPSATVEATNELTGLQWTVAERYGGSFQHQSPAGGRVSRSGKAGRVQTIRHRSVPAGCRSGSLRRGDAHRSAQPRSRLRSRVR